MLFDLIKSRLIMATCMLLGMVSYRRMGESRVTWVDMSPNFRIMASY